MAKVRVLAGDLTEGDWAVGPKVIAGRPKGGSWWQAEKTAFTAELDDGRKFMAVTDSKTWRKIAAALFEREGSGDKSKGP